jgi:hypothetical protein
MLINWAWCFTFLTCRDVNGQSVNLAQQHADGALKERCKRTASWISGPR